MQKRKRLPDFVVQLAREFAPPLLLDFQKAGRKLLQLLLGQFHLREMFIGLSFHVLRVAHAEAGHQAGQQHAESEHDQQALGGSAPRIGELALAILKPLLIGGAEIAQHVIQFAPARHDFALQEGHLLGVGGMRHGPGKRLADGPEVADTLADLRHYVAMVGRTLQDLKRPLILGSHGPKLGNQQVALRVGGVDEIVADVDTGQPQVPAECGEGIVLFDEVAINLEMLLRNTALNAVRLDGGQHQDGYDGAVAGSQSGSFAPRGRHCIYLSAPMEVQENTIFAVFQWRPEEFSIRIFRLSWPQMARGPDGLPNKRVVALPGATWGGLKSRPLFLGRFRPPDSATPRRSPAPLRRHRRATFCACCPAFPYK